MQNVIIEDDNDNWLLWGRLVDSWIPNDPANPPPRPTTVGELRAAMNAAGVVGIVEGADNRVVTFVDYTDDVTQPLIIPLPTRAMVQTDDRELDAVAMRPPGQRRYPLPAFYTVLFGGAAMVDLGNNELHAMARRRLGEYVINECM